MSCPAAGKLLDELDNARLDALRMCPSLRSWRTGPPLKEPMQTLGIDSPVRTMMPLPGFRTGVNRPNTAVPYPSLHGVAGNLQSLGNRLDRHPRCFRRLLSLGFFPGHLDYPPKASTAMQLPFRPAATARCSQDVRPFHGGEDSACRSMCMSHLHFVKPHGWHSRQSIAAMRGPGDGRAHAVAPARPASGPSP